MDKNDILDYVTETPGNTNRAVLGSMLDSFTNGGRGSTLEVNLIRDERTGDATTNKTWNEIYSAFPNAIIKYVHGEEYGVGIILSVLTSGGSYTMFAILADDNLVFEAQSPDEPLVMVNE